MSLKAANKYESYKYELDGLRALAVIAVIINHLNPNFIPSGFLGVDIFFVISGYVITLSTVGKRYSSLRIFIFNFYKRRIRKIMPGLIFYVLTMSLFISLFSINTNGKIFTGISSLFGISNIALYIAEKIILLQMLI